MEFSDILKKLRKDRKLTQQQLADVLGIKKESVYRYEAGKRRPTYEVVKRLEDYFQVTLNYLHGKLRMYPTEKIEIGEAVQGNITNLIIDKSKFTLEDSDNITFMTQDEINDLQLRIERSIDEGYNWEILRALLIC